MAKPELPENVTVTITKKGKDPIRVQYQEGEGKVREYDGNGKIVWEYAMELGGRPRSPGHGPEGHGVEVFGAIRLPNGNTLICADTEGHIFEVTATGEVVWEYRVPFTAAQHDELTADLFEVVRLPRSWLR